MLTLAPGGVLYWTSVGTDGRIRAAELGIRRVTVLANGQPDGWGIHVAQDRVFWTSGMKTFGGSETASVRSVFLDGGMPVPLVADGGVPVAEYDTGVRAYWVATNGTQLYWNNNLGSEDFYWQDLGFAPGVNIQSFDSQNGNIVAFLILNGTIYAGNSLDQLDITPLGPLDGGVIPGAAPGSAISVATDGEAVFWGGDNGAIFRHYPGDGGTAEVTTVAGLVNIYSMFVEGGYLYFVTAGSTYDVKRIPANAVMGTPQSLLFAPSSVPLRGIVVAGDYVFWGQQSATLPDGGTSGAIMALRKPL